MVSIKPQPWPEPDPQVAAAVTVMYPRGGKRERPLAVAVRDELGELFADREFAEAFGTRGQPGLSPGQLAMVTVLQFTENLTDRQAADAVRDKVSWKYCLGLPLADPGFDFTVLSQFRSRLAGRGLEEKALDVLLAALKDKGLLRAGGKQRTDSTHVVSAVRDLNRLELAGESVRAALEALAAAAPGWLAQAIDVSAWGTRYAARVDSWRLPASETARKELAIAYARDGYALLEAIYRPGAPGWLREVPAVQVLRTMLVQNYVRVIGRNGREVIRRREPDADGLPPARSRITSPYDTDARWAAKGENLFWNGYKVHITETCEDGAAEDGAAGGSRGEPPNIITGVATTDATVPDNQMTGQIHQSLDRRGLLPGEHYADSGYPSAEGTVTALREYGIVLVSPLLADTSRQARAGQGYDRSAFAIDFGARRATCPQGQVSSSWNPVTQRGTEAIVITFPASACAPCPARELCTTSRRRRRQLTIHPEDVHQAQAAARAQQGSRDWQARYARRAGVEGTIRQGIAVTGMRRARYRGLPKTRLEHVYSAVALNLIRLHAWWNGHPLDRTRTSHLARLELALAT